MAIELQEDELQFVDIQQLFEKTKNLAAKMISKYFNFEIIPEEDILIQTILVEQDCAMVTAEYTKISLRFRLVVNEESVKLQTKELTFEERIDGEREWT